MNRRAYLATAGTLIASTPGCTALGSNSNTYLKPTQRTTEAEGNLPYPANGEELPEVTMTDPITDEEITTTEFDRDVVMTFFYSNCKTVCPLLISSLRNIQRQAQADGYSDDVVLLAMSFDPARDDAQRLRTYADEMKVDLDAGNWHFLRPNSPKRAKEVVTDTFGVYFERNQPETVQDYMFTHFAAILLANKQHYVERAYTGQQRVARWQPLYEDLSRLRDREG